MTEASMMGQESKQVQILSYKIKNLQNQIDILQHEHKKALLQAKTELEFERNRAVEFQDKYKASIKYKNEQQNFKKILSQLDDKLSSKENQILQLMQADHDKKAKISQLTAQLDSYKGNSQLRELKQQLLKIQQAAYAQIIGKQERINQLLEKIEQYEENSNQKNMKQMIVELQEKYRQLEERVQLERAEAQELLIGKQQQLEEIREKFDSLRERSEERIHRLEQDIVEYERHIEKINQEKYHEESLQEKYYLTEDKLRKAEKKSHDLELAFKDEKDQYEIIIVKLEQQLENEKKQTQESKCLQQKVKQLEKQIKNKSKELQEAKNSIERVKGEHIKKYTAIESEKKKLMESLEIKIQQLEKLKQEIQERSVNRQNNGVNLPQVSEWSASGKTQSNQETPSPSRRSNSRKEFQEAIGTIDKLKSDIKDKQQNAKALNKKLHQQAKQIQQLRHKLLEQSGSSSRSQNEAKLMVQIQDLNSHIKKMENNLMINKLKHAQDQSYWNMKQVKSKKQMQEIQRQFKKQKAELLQRIDRMKKNTVKDKKMDYYQSSLK